jgi:hypothetical protein
VADPGSETWEGEAGSARAIRDAILSGGWTAILERFAKAAANMRGAKARRLSCPNSSAPQSCWPAFFVRADGITIGRLRRNVSGVLVSTVDTGQDLYDSTAAWRERAMAGDLHSGTLASDPRSADRTQT